MTLVKTRRGIVDCSKIEIVQFPKPFLLLLILGKYLFSNKKHKNPMKTPRTSIDGRNHQLRWVVFSHYLHGFSTIQTMVFLVISEASNGFTGPKPTPKLRAKASRFSHRGRRGETPLWPRCLGGVATRGPGRPQREEMG